MPLRVGAQRIKQYLFGLLITAISDVDIGLCYRIDFVGVELAHGGHEIGMKDAVTGINVVPASGTKNRRGLTHRHRPVFVDSGLARPSVPAPQDAPKQQRQCRCTRKLYPQIL